MNKSSRVLARKERKEQERRRLQSRIAERIESNDLPIAVPTDSGSTTRASEGAKLTATQYLTISKRAGSVQFADGARLLDANDATPAVQVGGMTPGEVMEVSKDHAGQFRSVCVCGGGGISV